MDDYLIAYLLLMAHMASGALWLIRINRKLDPEKSQKQWTKYIIYVLIVNLLWFCIIYSQLAFIILGIILIFIATAEWWKAVNKLKGNLWFSLIFVLLMAGFWRFLYLDQQTLLLVCWTVVLFDGASQISGQLAGKRKLLPKISPGKTWEGLMGGALVTLLSGLLVQGQFSDSWISHILWMCLIMAAAFVGDLLASLVKRRVGIKTYSRILPGHGGAMDRFDSLFTAGAFVFYIQTIQTLFH
jgi:phosphatidate cytidylyltransferase